MRKANSSPRSHPSKLHVLVVDDDPSNLEALRLVLQRGGSRITTASSAAEAMEVFEQETPDVLLSDIGMPGESGYDLIRKVRELPKERGGDIPAAALTAYAEPEDREDALRSGFMMHIPKPVDPVELLTLVSELARMAA
ncbi:response regulator [Pendulispora brunnea]|uniref:Response regulator n=1 Tax=Pendulispora brunnea TaxID=2905690 RepID=A0ABZ2KBJ2_9BACT